MREGVIVLDPNGRVVSLNPAAQTILGAPAKQLLGMPLQDLLANGTDQAEMMLGTGPNPRYYQLQFSSLDDWRGLEVGRLLLLHDVTEQKRAQSQLLEQQRALAMLYEREQLARELHDGIGQVLGFVKLQAQAARTWLALDQKTAADSDLEKLIAVAQDAHADVREYILGAKLAVSDQDSFILSLRHYLQRFSEHYGLRTELIAPPEWSDNFLEPTAEVQLLRIIQEALSNARKHAQAQTVQVIIHLDEIQAQVTIQDDGVGFEPAGLANDGGQKYGLEFLRQRAVEVGGSAEIHSAPGQGTRVVVCVPLKDTVELDRLGGVEKGRGEHV
jgi:signal transduction histidine kinase